MSSFKAVSEMDLKIKLSQPRYMIVFKPLDEELYSGFAKDYDEDNAGVDVFCRENVEIAPGKMAMLKLGLTAKLMGPEYGEDPMWLIRNYHYWLLPRSSISKKGLIMANSVGVIDKSYRGELMGAVVNVRDEPVKVARGERLFQIVAPDMGWICMAKKAREYNNEAAEEEYLMKEKAFNDAVADIKWPEEMRLESSKKARVEWLQKNDYGLYQKLCKLRYEADYAAEYRPSVANRLREIEYGKYVAIIEGGIFGPFESQHMLDKATETFAFKSLPIVMHTFRVNPCWGTMVMDDTSRGAGGFGSTGK